MIIPRELFDNCAGLPTLVPALVPSYEEPMHQKMTGLITSLKRSPNAMDDFEKCKERLGKTKGLLQDVDTRWNSTFLMMQR